MIPVIVFLEEIRSNSRAFCSSQQRFIGVGCRTCCNSPGFRKSWLRNPRPRKSRAYSSGRFRSKDHPKIPVRRTSGSGAGGGATSACGGCGGAGKFSHFIEYTNLPSAVRPMGAQLSTRAVTLLGTNLVCAHAGDEIRRIANTSFFIGFSRETCAIYPLLNRIRHEKSNDVMAPGKHHGGRKAERMMPPPRAQFRNSNGACSSPKMPSPVAGIAIRGTGRGPFQPRPPDRIPDQLSPGLDDRLRRFSRFYRSIN